VFLDAPPLGAAALVSALPATGARAVRFLISHFVIHGIKASALCRLKPTPHAWPLSDFGEGNLTDAALVEEA
jgi:hypothetical protein